MKKNFLCIITVLGTLVLSGCSDNNLSVTGENVKSVVAITASNESYAEYVKYSGFVSSDELKRFSFELSGKINNVAVEEGQQIKKGDVLATLDTTAVQMAIDNAKENIRLAENQLEQIDSSIEKLNIGLEAENLTLEKAKTGLEAEELSLSKIEQGYNSNIAKIQLRYDNAQETFNNIASLYNKGVAAKTDYDDAKLAFDTISEELSNTKQTMEKDIDLQKKNIEAMKNSYQLQQTSIKNIENDISAAQVKKQAAQISLDQAKISLDQNNKYLTDSTLKSTIDGYVMSIPLHAGEVTGAGTPVVVVKSGKEVINVGIPVEDYGRLSVGMSAIIEADGKELNGTITNISLYPDEATRTYNVEITPEDMSLAMGSLVTVRININQKNGCFVPISSVFNIDGVNYVYVAEAADNDKYKVIKKEVTLGDENGENVLVTGINPNDRVISKGIADISENQIVCINE